jgi:hypothetical protein
MTESCLICIYFGSLGGDGAFGLLLTSSNACKSKAVVSVDGMFAMQLSVIL